MKSETFPIKKELLPLYNFIWEGNELIAKKGENGDIVDMQLNSIRNYVRYHVTELAVKMKESNAAEPLRAIILGCTHYPYFEDEIKSHLLYLAEYRDDAGNKPFEKYLKSGTAIVDPAVLTACQTMLSLVSKGIKRTSGDSKCQFYISVPNKNLDGVSLNPRGGFSYEYKYGRKPYFTVSDTGMLPPQYVLRIPMLWETLDTSIIKRIRERLPMTFKLMTDFNDNRN